ncbi:SMI1/KNR4 family protein [Thalassoroseus pseudoceratinae]|uniref:SMI1/KNR4 family protein n=1 Tax=Thalassoroseus pseudoceratinae TaxID=2713176 RepID=UPI0014200812|nr:SMI1/KNR4 family protein [Thalassoroseus pseudoceratinae]
MKHFTDAMFDAIRSEAEAIREGATTVSVAKLDAELDNQLPPSYKEFVSKINGGAIGSIRLFGVDRSDYLDLRAKIEELGSFIPSIARKIMIPVASDWGGSLFCLDTYHPDENGELPVWYWNHEYSEEPADAPYVWSQIYDGFGSFIRDQLATKTDE